jgi:hypothetical protein
MPKEMKTDGLEYFTHEGDLFAIVLRSTYHGDSIHFFTPDSFSQQLGYLPHKKGASIKPHDHRVNSRQIHYTQETLFIKKGKVKVTIYDLNHRSVYSELLESGDIILLCGGGHGFEMLEDTIMIAVKQGPFTGDDDKKVFEGV